MRAALPFRARLARRRRGRCGGLPSASVGSPLGLERHLLSRRNRSPTAACDLAGEVAARGRRPRLTAGGRTKLAGSPSVEHAAFALGGSARAALPPRDRQRGPRWRRRVVYEAGSGFGCPDPLLNHPNDLDRPGRVVDKNAHLVAGGDWGGRLGRLVVDAHMTASAGGSGVGTSLREPHRPEPAVYSGGLHPTIMTGADSTRHAADVPTANVAPAR